MTEEPALTGVDVHAGRRSVDPRTYPHKQPGEFWVQIGGLSLHLDANYAERLEIVLRAARAGEFTTPRDDMAPPDPFAPDPAATHAGGFELPPGLP